jgi:Evolutionarily conserved signalling intermediate in Toll pathway
MNESKMNLVKHIKHIAGLPVICTVQLSCGLRPALMPLMLCSPIRVCHPFHTSSIHLRFLDARDPDHDKKEKQLVIHQGEYFDEAAKRARDKRTYEEAVALYLKRNALYRRGHVEFIYAALARMKEFNVHRDIDTYKKLLGLFPEGKMIAQTTWQVEFMHYPKQQQCCIDILDQMESNGMRSAV